MLFSALIPAYKALDYVSIAASNIDPAPCNLHYTNRTASLAAAH